MAESFGGLGEYEIRSEPVPSTEDYSTQWFGVYLGHQRVMIVEVRVSGEFVAARGVSGDEESRSLARQQGESWIRAHLSGASYIRGVRYRVTYAVAQPSPRVEILGRLSA